jgi:hypothetical protein
MIKEGRGTHATTFLTVPHHARHAWGEREGGPSTNTCRVILLPLLFSVFETPFPLQPSKS